MREPRSQAEQACARSGGRRRKTAGRHIARTQTRAATSRELRHAHCIELDCAAHRSQRRTTMPALPATRLLHRFATLGALLIAPALSAHAQSAPPQPAHGAAPEAHKPFAPRAVEGVINLNTATLDELTRLPGVGPSRAQAILEVRSKLGGFKKLDDLMRVKGIGRKTFRKLEPLLRLDGKTTLVEIPRPHPQH
jgi:competence ComEA-like helix-hairpin-helix protein